MSLGVSARIKLPKKHHELAKSHSQTQLLANRLRQDGVPSIVESVLQGVEQVAAVLAQPHLDPKLCYEDSIINLCQHLKIYGSYLDMLFEDQLNRAFVIFRNSSQDERLGNLSRLHLLQLIELRAKRWKVSDQMNHYYKKKIEASESTTSMTESLVNMSTASTSPPLLNPGELIKTSGKFNKPTRIPGKNYCKDEVVIRNADSGKVMGIKGRRVHMIEELSETIISFQRVNPGAKERLVQITGANEESINHSKQLIEDTIRRNASPVREPAMAGPPLTGSTSSINSSASEESFLPTMRTPRALLHSLSTNDANIGEYKYSVVTNGHTIKISGDNLDLIRTSKLVLDEYFSGEPFYNFESFDNMLVTPTEIKPASLLNNGPKEVSIPDDSFVPLRRPKKSLDEIMNGNTSSTKSSSKKSNSRKNSLSTEKRIVYSLEDLARLAMSPLGLIPPVDWERIYTDYPAIVRKVAERFDLNQYLFDRTGDMNTLVSADEDAELQ